jgi:NADPH-dependent 2,4-dienoyl-CoA reductase/sulfur reductase-like enzyme
VTSEARLPAAPRCADAAGSGAAPGPVREPAARIVVLGAGPAGLAAARAAARALRAARGDAPGASGAQPEPDVLLVDAAPLPGGQIWRARRGIVHEETGRALDELAALGVRVLAATRVVAALPQRRLLIDGPEGAQCLRWQRLVLAGGARERLLPFPGWTLPGVFGAGGLQALAKGGWPVAGRRVLVGGTGPLLLAAAATLRREGARLAGVADEAGPGAHLRFVPALLAHPRKAADAARLARALGGVRFLRGWRIVAAEGAGRLERVRLAPVGPRADAARDRVVECDALAAGWGLVPDVGLARMLGCELAPCLGAPAVVVDAAQRTSVVGVYAAGEATGVAGARAAALQGGIAGTAAAHGLLSHGAQDAVDATDAAARRALARERRFAAAVARCFAPPADLAARLAPDTLVCRCEDVPWSSLAPQPDLRSAKLATRCGMGHCQGRICQGALGAIGGATALEPHLPLMPVALGALLAIDDAGPSSDPSPLVEPLT